MITRFQIAKFRFDDRTPQVVRRDFVRETKLFLIDERGSRHPKHDWRFASEQQAVEAVIASCDAKIAAAHRLIENHTAEKAEAMALLAVLKGGAA